MQFALSNSALAACPARMSPVVQLRRATQRRPEIIAIKVQAAASHGSTSPTFPVDSLARRAVLASVPVISAVSVADRAFARGKIPAPEDVASPPSDAEITSSGLASKVLKKEGDGKGGSPLLYDTVTFDYTGWTTDGEMFESSVTSGKPVSFPLVNSVIKGWTEGLQLMEIGESRRFWIPEELAYKGASGKPAGMLVFDVTLFDIKRGPKPPEVPVDVASPPADADVTASGLASKVLQASSKDGARKPGPTSTVTVDYSGWTTSGNLFDSSVLRGKKASFPLNRVIPGWTEGLQLMVEGERRRFWIPAEQAYGKCPPPREGAPCGMLVFDVELFSVDK